MALPTGTRRVVIVAVAAIETVFAVASVWLAPSGWARMAMIVGLSVMATLLGIIGIRHADRRAVGMAGILFGLKAALLAVEASWWLAVPAAVACAVVVWSAMSMRVEDPTTRGDRLDRDL